MLPLKYLDLPLDKHTLYVKEWDLMVTKVQNRLALYKVSLFSTPVKLVLLKLVLSSLPLYFMALFMI